MPPPLNLTPEMIDYLRGVDTAWASGWNAELASGAVASHMRGYFVASNQLAKDLPRYPPIRAALAQRVSAARSAEYSITGPTRAPGRIETEAAQRLWYGDNVEPEKPKTEEDPVDDARSDAARRAAKGPLARLQKSTFRDLAMLGFSVWQHPIVVDPVTLRHEITTIERWPLGAVEYVTHGDGAEGYYAVTAEGEYIPLPPPGTTDGHWTVVGEGDRPHEDGAVISLDMSFVAGQLGRRAFANMISTMGKASPICELPDEVSPDEQEGKDMLGMVKALGTKQAAGVHRKGGRVYPFEVTSRTGDLLPQVTDEQARMVAWALLGHDATISRGDVYNDPTAQSVPQDLTREDVRAFALACSNLFAVLARLNLGVDVEAPRLVAVLPDADQDARRKAANERRAALDAHRSAQLAAGKAAAEQITAERAAGVVVDETRVAQVYEIAGLLPPVIAPTTPKGDSVFAYDLDGGIVSVNEQRARKGEQPAPYGYVTVPDLRARIAAGWTTNEKLEWVPPGGAVMPAQPAQNAPSEQGTGAPPPAPQSPV